MGVRHTRLVYPAACQGHAADDAAEQLSATADAGLASLPTFNPQIIHNMGCDAVNDLSRTRRQDVEDFLQLLGYVRAKPLFRHKGHTTFSFYPEHDYAFVTGVGATVAAEDSELKVHTRTTVWRSRADSDFHNRTIRELRKRFGGTFETDVGHLRYFRYSGPDRRDAEAGAFRAYSVFEQNHALAAIALQNISESDTQHEKMPVQLRHVYPVVSGSNMIVPFLVAAVEEYLRSTFVAMLRYSPRRDTILRDVRVTAGEVAQLLDQGLLVEEVAARKMSFQDMRRVQQHFQSLNNKHDLAGWLRKPYHRRRESLYQAIERLVEHRHALVHRAEILGIYDQRAARQDVDTVHAAVKRIYSGLLNVYGWSSAG